LHTTKTFGFTTMATLLLSLSLLIYTLISVSGRLNTNGIITCNTCQHVENLKSDSHISINGYNSGQDSTIQSPIIECHGNQACISTQITANQLDCDGSGACKQSKLNIDKLLTCSEDSACKESIITMNENAEIYALGSNALTYAQITGATIIHGYGNRALTSSYITSVENKDLTIYNYGVSAGIDANIVCKSGSKCTIECESSGCKDLTITCLSGSNCHLIPDLCETQTHSGSIVDETDCPILIISDTKDDDKILLNEIEENFYTSLDTLNMIQSEQIIQEMITRSSSTLSTRLYGDIIIDSKGGNFEMMKIEMDNTMAEMHATVICGKGYECNLSCIGSRACGKSQYLCYYNSVCHINCVGNIDGQCPEIHQSLSLKDDKRFDDYLRNRYLNNNGYLLMSTSRQKKSKEMMKTVTDFMLNSWPYLLLSSILLILFVIGIFGLIYYFIKNRQTQQLNTYNNPLFLK